LFRRETVANLICANNTIVSPRRESSGDGEGYRSSRLRFSRRRHNANNGRPFSLNGQEGEGKEPRGKSTPVAHCRERSLLTVRLTFSSPPSLSFSLSLSLSLSLSSVSLCYVKVIHPGVLLVNSSVPTTQIINIIATSSSERGSVNDLGDLN